MSDQPDDIRQWLQELISRSASDQLDNLKRFDELLRRAARGEVDQSRLRDEYLNFSREESLRYINDLTRVGLGFYNTLLELNRHYNERFFDRVLRDRWSQNGVPPVAKREPRIISMELSATVGEVASSAFIIENHRKENVAVAFLVSDFTDESGLESFRPPLQLSPARFSLRPGEEHQVSLHIPLLPELFQVGEVYTATVVVSGFDELQLRLVVRPSAASAAQESGITIQPSRNKVPAEAAQAGASPAPADDLARIKGIGPTYQRKLDEGGVRTFARLAAMNDQALLDLFGSQGMARARRSQWREQARLAALGEWQALEKLQAKIA